jgi:hypothetical protein
VIEFQPVALPDEAALAQTAGMIPTAGLMSLQTGIQMVHPDWAQHQVDEEPDRIFSQIGLALSERTRISQDRRGEHRQAAAAARVTQPWISKVVQQEKQYASGHR